MDALLIDPNDDDKTIFTGHRGSGKTTELARLEEKLRPAHTVVRFNVEGPLNLGDVDYADLLVVLGLQVFQKARDSGVGLNEDRLHDLLFWYKTHVFEEGERGKLESEVGGELDAVFAKFSVKLTTDAPYRRETVRAEAQANLSDLLERLNALLEDLQEKSGRSATWREAPRRSKPPSVTTPICSGHAGTLARLYLRQGWRLDALAQYESLQENLPPGLRPSFEQELDAVTDRLESVDGFTIPLADPGDLLEGAT